MFWIILLFGCASFAYTELSPSITSNRYYNDRLRPSPHMRPNRTHPILPNPQQKAFEKQTSCVEKCASECHPMFREDETLIYLCLEVKPPEHSLKDRLFKEASWPWLMFLTVLAAAFLFCLLVMFWSCCCRRIGRTPRSSRTNGFHQNYFVERDPLSTSKFGEEQTMAATKEKNCIRNGGDIHTSNSKRTDV